MDYLLCSSFEDFCCKNHAAIRSRLATPFQCKLESTEPFVNFGSNFKISFDSLQIRQVPFDMEAMRVPFALYFICSISSVIFVFVKYSPTRRVSAISKILSRVSLLISTNQNPGNCPIRKMRLLLQFLRQKVNLNFEIS